MRGGTELGGSGRGGRGRIAGSCVLGAGSAGSGFRKYSEYRDSGVEWLGEIPAHWEVKRLKTIAGVRLSNVDKKTVPGQVPVMLCNYVDVYYNDKIADDIDFMLATATEDQVERFSLRKGDVLITKDSEDPTDIAVPAVIAEDSPGVVCGYHLAQVRPSGVCDGSYLARAFATAGVRDQFSIAANGITRFGLTSRAIADSVFPLPPLAEQRAIADFLDRVTERIGGLMEKKERLVRLLRERRGSLISHAVTRGLDPDAPMKKTGIEWLGEIPAHWDIHRLKTFADVKISNVDKKTTHGQVSVRLCNYTDVYYRDEIAADSGLMAATATEDQVERLSLRKGDVLITKDSETPDDIAVPAVIAKDLPGVVSGYHLAHLTPVDTCDGRYLKRAFESIGPREQFRIAANGVTRYGLTASALGSGQFPFPPYPEQVRIADHLDRECRKLDTLIEKIGSVIDRLLEYRSAIISAAVTGTVDVQQATVP